MGKTRRTAGHAVYDLIAGLPEAVLDCAQYIERGVRAWIATDARERAAWARYEARRAERPLHYLFEDAETPSAPTSFWDCASYAIEQYLNAQKPPPKPARTSRNQERKSRKQRAREMLRARARRPKLYAKRR